MTQAAQHVCGVEKGISGPRFWLGASASGSGSRLSPEERAARDAEKARKAAEKAEAKAAKVREAEVAAYDVLLDALELAAKGGRLTTEQAARLAGLQ